MSEWFLGVDFGTTNSVLSVSNSKQEVFSSQFLFQNQPIPMARSVLFFSNELRESNGQPLLFTGPQAMEQYLEEGGEGRMILSPKQSLASQLSDKTQVFLKTFTLAELISFLLKDIIALSEKQFKGLGSKAVVGRPVVFHGQKSVEDEERALSRLTEAFRLAGLEEVHFEMEPVAAAYKYEHQTQKDETILIADFGGGTTDFCVMNVGPSMKNKSSAERILGRKGIPVAGDLFDTSIIDHIVCDAMGKNSFFFSEGNKKLPMPSWPYSKLRQWYTIHHLQEEKTLNLLYELKANSTQSDKLSLFIEFIEENLGYFLFQSIEKTKIDLSQQEKSLFYFGDCSKPIQQSVQRKIFEQWNQSKVELFQETYLELLKELDVKKEQIDKVFLTGGTSFIPAIRKKFVDDFGSEKISSGGEFTSVSQGLSLMAQERFS